MELESIQFVICTGMLLTVFSLNKSKGMYRIIQKGLEIAHFKLTFQWSTFVISVLTKALGMLAVVSTYFLGKKI